MLWAEEGLINYGPWTFLSKRLSSVQLQNCEPQILCWSFTLQFRVSSTRIFLTASLQNTKRLNDCNEDRFGPDNTPRTDLARSQRVPITRVFSSFRFFHHTTSPRPIIHICLETISILSNIPGVICFLNRPPSLFITGKSGLPGVFIIGESRPTDDENTGGVDQCVES